MIPARWRLSLRGNHSLIFKGTKRRGDFAEVTLNPQIGTTPKAAVIVGKNVHPLASKRNLIKRRVREILRKRVLPTSKNVMVVKMTYKSRNATYAQLETEIAKLARP